MIEKSKYIVLFDGDCGLCNIIARFISKRKKKDLFTLLPLQSEKGRKYLQIFNLPLYDLSSFVYIRNGNCYLRSEAGLRLLKDIGGVWKLFYVFRLMPRSIRDHIYDVIAKNRVRFFGHTTYCPISLEE